VSEVRILGIRSLCSLVDNDAVVSCLDGTTMDDVIAESARRDVAADACLRMCRRLAKLEGSGIGIGSSRPNFTLPEQSVLSLQRLRHLQSSVAMARLGEAMRVARLGEAMRVARLGEAMRVARLGRQDSEDETSLRSRTGRWGAAIDALQSHATDEGIALQCEAAAYLCACQRGARRALACRGLCEALIVAASCLQASDSDSDSNSNSDSDSDSDSESLHR